MAGPRRIYIQEGTGIKVPGVTTHTGVLAKPALIFWGYKQGLYNYEELSKLMAKLFKTKAPPKELLERAVKALTTFAVLGLYEKRDEAADAGTLGHAFVENHLRGLPDPDTKGLPKAVIDKAEGCYLTFLDWEKGRQIKVLESEYPITSEKRPFGGTIDHVIETPLTSTPARKAVEILDIKTGKDIYMEAKVQVGTYGALWIEKHPDIPIGGYNILRLGPNGEFTHKFFPDLLPYFQKIFLPCMEIHGNLKELGEKL